MQYLTWGVFFIVSESTGTFMEVLLHKTYASARNLEFVFPLKFIVPYVHFLSADLLLPRRPHIF
jgi:hypothetical protein